MNLFWKITSLTFCVLLFSCSSAPSSTSATQQLNQLKIKTGIQAAKNSLLSTIGLKTIDLNTIEESVTSKRLFAEQGSVSTSGNIAEKTLINKNANQHNRNSRSLEHVQYYQTISSQQHRKAHQEISTQNRSVFARNTRYKKQTPRQTYSNSLSDRELMLSFYRSPQTIDEALIAKVIVQDQQFIQNNHTGYESMYVSYIPTRGTTAVDPASVKLKSTAQKHQARFGMIIAGR